MKTNQSLFKETLSHNVPDLFNLLDGQNISWSSIESNILKQNTQRLKESKSSGKDFKIEMNFYDLILKVIDEDFESTRFFVYIIGVLRLFNEYLSTNEKILVSRIIRKLLKDLTLDYIHYIGELFVLDILLRNHPYTLTEIEYKLNNGKCIDFHFTTKENEQVFVEVMNIRLDPMKLNSHREIREYLRSKYLSKIEDKMTGVEWSFELIIVPVLWGSLEDLRKVYNFYRNGTGLRINGVTEPYSYCCKTHPNIEQPIFRFSEISILFN